MLLLYLYREHTSNPSTHTCNIEKQVGGRGAVSSTVENTKKKVTKLQRRSAWALSRSEGSGLTDFSEQDTSCDGSGSSSIDNSARSSINNSNNGKSATVLNGISDGDVPAESKAPLGAGAVPEEPAGDGNTGKKALFVSGTSSAVGSERVLTPDYAVKDGEGKNERTENQEKVLDDEEGVQEQEGKTAAGRVGAFLAALPLSKFKIVIGKNYGFQ